MNGTKQRRNTLFEILFSCHVSCCRDAPVRRHQKHRLFTVPYFSVGFSRLVCFYRTPAILVCNVGRSLGRVSKLLRGAEVGRRRDKLLIFSLLLPHSTYSCTLTRVPLGSLDTLPRLRSPLQTKMEGTRSQRTSLENSTEKEGTVNSLLKRVINKPN